MLLSINNLEVRYGGIRALQDVSLHIDHGEIVTLIGSNGAGKTTLLRTISGLLRPAMGTIRWHNNSSTGTELHTLPPHEIVALGISHVPEGRQIFANMTVRENLLLGGYLRKTPSQAAVPVSVSDKHPTAGEEILTYQKLPPSRVLPADPNPEIEEIFRAFPVLGERRHQKAGTLSGGEQQMLAISRALMARPKLLLLDEPSLGLAPLIVRQIFGIIREINAHGTTIFLVEQNAHMALSVAHRGYVLQTGRVVKSDVASSLLEDPDVKKAYLGGE
jgi:branched-chain amino acid transport system ATP-binding protein